jgi:hypothetical protein
VIAKALPNDDVIAECEDEVAVVHLTWTQKQERRPWPLTTFMASADEFESHLASEYDWDPDARSSPEAAVDACSAGPRDAHKDRWFGYQRAPLAHLPWGGFRRCVRTDGPHPQRTAQVSGQFGVQTFDLGQGITHPRADGLPRPLRLIAEPSVPAA